MNISKPMKTIVSVTALCTLMAFSSISSANNSVAFDSPKHHQKGGDNRGKMMKRMVKVLSLSEHQQAQIKGIKKQAKVQHKSLRDSIKQFKKQEKALIHAEVFDEQAFIALQASYQANFAQVGLAKAKTKHAIFSVLTIEQQQKWLKRMAKRKKKSNRN